MNQKIKVSGEVVTDPCAESIGVTALQSHTIRRRAAALLGISRAHLYRLIKEGV
jgi:hypothetical protein